MLAQQVQGLQGVGADVSTAAATAAAAQTAAERAAAAASEAAAAAVAARQVVQQQEAAVIAAVEQRMQAAAAAVQDSVGAKLTALESSHLQLQQEAVGFAGQLQQLQEQQQVLLANQDMLLARQQEQGGDLDAGRALQQQLADRLQGLEPLQQQVRVLQEGADAHAAAGCAAADASAAAAAAACDEVGRVREEVRGLATKVEGLQQQLQQREDEGKGSAGDDLGVLSRDVAALQEQLQGVQGAVTALQEQQQQAGSHIPSVQQQEQQLTQQQAQQRLGDEVAVLSGRVGELAAELAACSEAVSLTLPLRLVEVEDRVAATAQTCAEAVKVRHRGEEREGWRDLREGTGMEGGREAAGIDMEGTWQGGREGGGGH
jgi:chromosome segregation ATPase